MANTWRYWRATYSAPLVNDFLEAFEIEFLTGATDQTSPGGTLSANFSAGTLSNLIDNNTGTFWPAWSANHAAGVTLILTYDFGGSQANWKAIDGHSYMCRTGRGPKNGGTVDCSHDNTNWTNAYNIASGLTWGSSEKKTFSFSSPNYSENKRTMIVVQR